MKPNANSEAHRFEITIDGQPHHVVEPVLSGRQLLHLAGRAPVDEHLVFFLGRDGVLEDINLDETVDLRASGVEQFLTFRADRSFRFELDGKRQDWGAAVVTGATLLKLAGAVPGTQVWLEQIGQPDKFIRCDEIVKLTAPGVERFRSKRTTIITVVNEDNGRDFLLEADPSATIEKTIADVYVKLGVARQQDDRLRCDRGGDVFQYAALTVREYVDGCHCPCLVWLFAGGTGGAICL